MTRKERLMRTFAGKTVDRPAVSFYEIDGFNQNPEDTAPCNICSDPSDDPSGHPLLITDPFNIYSDPSWHPLLALACEKSDVIATTGTSIADNGRTVNITPKEHIESNTEEVGDRRITKTQVRCKDRVLSSETVRERNIDTTWTTEHLLKDTDDLKAWLDLPLPEFNGEVETKKVLDLEKRIGDAGCIMLNTLDPLAVIGPLFEMGTYTVIALTEQDLFSKALDKALIFLEWQLEMISKALPGRIWRIIGPEYASPPYLPPELFKKYVTKYDRHLVDIIHKHGGYARLHSHGNLKEILDYIVDTGCMGLDPIEPPPQGDVELSYVRQNYGKELVLFGNLEASDLENLSQEKFREKIKIAISEGTTGEGKGFVLMPSASPYGRKLSSVAMKNYETMIEEIEKL